jgi:hypothetical protein
METIRFNGCPRFSTILHRFSNGIKHAEEVSLLPSPMLFAHLQNL